MFTLKKVTKLYSTSNSIILRERSTSNFFQLSDSANRKSYVRIYIKNLFIHKIDISKTPDLMKRPIIRFSKNDTKYYWFCDHNSCISTTISLLQDIESRQLGRTDSSFFARTRKEIRRRINGLTKQINAIYWQSNQLA